MAARIKRRAEKPQLWVRHMQVTAVRARVCVTVERTPSSLPQQQASSHLVILCEFTEPVNDLTRAELRIYATDAQLGNREPPAFGVIAVGEQLLRIGTFIRREHWPDVWAMASAGALRCCRIAFTAPTHGQGVVTRLDLGNGDVEED